VTHLTAIRKEIRRSSWN